MSRRTIFRYFASKNDMVWGDFESVIERLRLHLAEGAELPMMEALRRAAVLSNRYPEDQLPELHRRLTLITTAPALQANSMLRYAAWRRAVAEWAAGRLDRALDERRLDERDAGLVTELCYGTTRRQLQLDEAIAQHADRKLEKIEDRVLAALRIGAYQRFFLRAVTAADIGTGESFMEGDWSSPDLVALVRLAVRNLRLLDSAQPLLSSVRALLSRIRHRLRSNSLRGSSRNAPAKQERQHRRKYGSHVMSLSRPKWPTRQGGMVSRGHVVHRRCRRKPLHR